MKINKQTVFYGTMVLAASNMMLQILGFVYRIMLSRILGATGMGVFQLVFPAISVVMSVCLSGLSMAVSRISAEDYALGDMRGLHRLIGTTQLIFSVLLISMSLPVCFFSKDIAVYLLGDGRVRAALFIAPIYIFLTGIENIYKSCFYGIRKVNTIVVSEITELLIRIGAVAALLYAFHTGEPGRAAALIMVGMIISEVFSAVFLACVYKKKLSHLSGYANQNNKSKNEKLLKNIALIALPISIAGLINNLLGSANAVLLPRGLVISGMSFEQAMQTFGILAGMIMPLFMLPFSFIGSLSAIIVPKLAEGVALKNPADIKRKTAKAIHATSLLAMPIIAVLVPLAPTICVLLYKQTIPEGYIWPLAIGSLLNYYRAITSSVLYGVGLQKRASAILVGGEVLQLAFTYFAVRNPAFGIYGYLAGFAISSFVEGMFNMISVVFKTKIKIQWINWFVFPIISGALTGFIARFAYLGVSSWQISEGMKVICALFCAIVGYYIILRFQGVHLLRYIKTLIPSNSLNKTGALDYQSMQN